MRSLSLAILLLISQSAFAGAFDDLDAQVKSLNNDWGAMFGGMYSTDEKLIARAEALAREIAKNQYLSSAEALTLVGKLGLVVRESSKAQAGIKAALKEPSPSEFGSNRNVQKMAADLIDFQVLGEREKAVTCATTRAQIGKDIKDLQSVVLRIMRESDPQFQKTLKEVEGKSKKSAFDVLLNLTAYGKGAAIGGDSNQSLAPSVRCRNVFDVAGTVKDPAVVKAFSEAVESSATGAR